MNHAARVRYPPCGCRDHILIGAPRHVLNVIANHRAAGTLVAVHTLRPISIDEPVARVRLRLRDTPPAPAAPSGSADRPAIRRVGRIAAIVAAVAAPVLGVVLAVAYLIGQLVEWVTAHAATLAGLSVLAILLIAALCGTRRRRHCPGC